MERLAFLCSASGCCMRFRIEVPPVPYPPSITDPLGRSCAGGGTTSGHPKATRAAWANVRTSSHLGSEESASSVHASLVGELLIWLNKSSSMVSWVICALESLQ